VLLTARYYRDGESLTTSQNDSHSNPWKDFIAGKAEFRREGNFSFWVGKRDGETFYENTGISFEGKGKGDARRTNYVTKHAHHYMQQVAYKPRKEEPVQQTQVEELINQFVDGQRLIIEKLLAISESKNPQT